MTASVLARAAPAPGAIRPPPKSRNIEPRRRVQQDYSHVDVRCSSCGMDSWSCSRFELQDDRPFPLKRCCSDCLTEDVHNTLGGQGHR